MPPVLLPRQELPRTSEPVDRSSDTLRSRRLFSHVVLPAVVMLTLLGMFFSGNRLVASLVVPEGNRELGLLEHLQLVPLAAMALLAYRARRDEESRIWRGAFLMLTLGSLFVLLEELNYGQHYFALLTGVGSEAEVGPRSLHNASDTTDLLKGFGDAGMAFLFVVLPYIAHLTRRAPLGALTPSIWYVATIALMVVLGQLTHLLAAAGLGPGWMTRNLSEFRELMIYYTGALYLGDVAQAREAARAPQQVVGERSGTARAA